MVLVWQEGVCGGIQKDILDVWVLCVLRGTQVGRVAHWNVTPRPRAQAAAAGSALGLGCNLLCGARGWPAPANCS
eukprot:2948414-Amphidinium_carterae.1